MSDLTSLPNIGKVTTKKLQKIGIKTMAKALIFKII
jgi:nucleotidyltransferase/DNA polymerase involved in DNA repair